MKKCLISSKNLYFLQDINYNSDLLFHFTLSDKRLKGTNFDWVSKNDSNVFLSLDEDIMCDFYPLFSCNNSFDEYGISEYYEESAKRLLQYIEKNLKENYLLDNEQFRKKYRNTLNYLENANEYGLSIQYDQNCDFVKVKDEIQIILNMIKYTLEKAIIENKVFIIYGI